MLASSSQGRDYSIEIVGRAKGAGDLELEVGRTTMGVNCTAMELGCTEMAIVGTVVEDGVEQWRYVLRGRGGTNSWGKH